MKGIKISLVGDNQIKTGTVFNIQRFSLHDGPGIRTTVFLKGCPLDCLWCHNPESKKSSPQLSFTSSHCISCGNCCKACPNGVHIFENKKRIVRWELCKAYGSCASECPSGALEIIGIKKDSDEIIEEVEKDIPFYGSSGGGMTISGGEPLMQPEFTLELLKKAKKKGINTTLDTCGFFDWERFMAMLPFLDLVLFDLKQMEPKLHKKLTGKDNKIILENLGRLVGQDARVIIRVPVIPGSTDDDKNLHQMGAFLNSFKFVPEVELLPYNMLAGSKHSRFGIENKLKDVYVSDKKKLNRLAEILSSFGIKAAAR